MTVRLSASETAVTTLPAYGAYSIHGIGCSPSAGDDDELELGIHIIIVRQYNLAVDADLFA